MKGTARISILEAEGSHLICFDMSCARFIGVVVIIGIVLSVGDIFICCWKKLETSVVAILVTKF